MNLQLPVKPILGLPLFKKTKIAILGIPYDGGQTFASGSRFAPYCIRIASESIEEYSFIAKKDVRECDASDWGDIEVSWGNYELTSNNVKEGLKKIGAEKYVFIGGDHSITIFLAYFFKNKIRKYVQLDAHADFENEYRGYKFNHATVLRRVGEILGWENVTLIGLRSVSKKAMKELETFGIQYYTTFDVLDDPDILKREVKDADYVSIDMDVFDPSFAPEVGNPEPLGISPKDLLPAVHTWRPIVVDIVEVVPRSINSITAILAASLIREIIIAMSKQ